MIVRYTKWVAPLMLAGSLGATASVSLAQGAEVQPPASAAPAGQQIQKALAAGELALDRRGFVQLVLLRNPEVLLTREQRRIAQQQLQFDRGAFTPEFFASLIADENNIQNPAVAVSPTTIERNQRFGIGVRTLLPTGAEITVEYEARDQFNNVSSANNPLGIDDVTGRLGFRVRQPLLRGVGAAQVDGRIAQSQRQLEISRQEIRQQMLSKSFDALGLYWRLYRAEQIRALNDASLDFARRTKNDMQQLVAAGRLPQTALSEARSTLLLREAEAFAARQAFDQVKSGVKGLLNLSSEEFGRVALRTTATPDATPWQRPDDFDRYLSQVLQTWPNHEIALARLAIEEHNVNMARDEMRPRLDLVLGYHQNSRRFDNSHSRALNDAFSDRHHGWNAGLEFSMPLGRNTPALARHEIAQIRLAQSRMQLEAVKVDLANQLWVRLEQVGQAFEELQRHRQNVEVLRELLAVERVRFETGASRYGDLIEREDRLNSGVVRMLDAEIRYEMAKTALQLSDGTLLASMGVQVDVE